MNPVVVLALAIVLLAGGFIATDAGLIPVDAERPRARG
jgi:hypothetical protein